MDSDRNDSADLDRDVQSKVSNEHGAGHDKLAQETVDRNRAAHVEAFEADHGPVDPEQVARFEEALDR
jgi:hypothetical protein